MKKSKEVWEEVVINTRLGRDRKWAFMTAKTKLTLPIKISGEIEQKGWDIPVCWAIDSANQCWADNAHGPTLVPVEVQVLLAEAGNKYEDQVKICETLGLDKPQPEWATMALAHGWTPPKK